MDSVRVPNQEVANGTSSEVGAQDESARIDYELWTAGRTITKARYRLADFQQALGDCQAECYRIACAYGNLQMEYDAQSKNFVEAQRECDKLNNSLQEKTFKNQQAVELLIQKSYELEEMTKDKERIILELRGDRDRCITINVGLREELEKERTKVEESLIKKPEANISRGETQGFHCDKNREEGDSFNVVKRSRSKRRRKANQ